MACPQEARGEEEEEVKRPSGSMVPPRLLKSSCSSGSLGASTGPLPSPQEGGASAGPHDEDLWGGQDQDKAGDEAPERCGGKAMYAGGREGPLSGVGEQSGEEKDGEGEEEAHLAFLG